MRVTAFLYVGIFAVSGLACSQGMAQATSAKFDCDTGSGSFSDLDLPQSGPSYHISGSISVKKLRPSSDWYPVANVRLVSGDKRTFGGIRLQIPEASRPPELVVQSAVGSGANDSPAGVLGKGEVAPFSIDVIGGKMTIRFGDRAFAGPDVGTAATIQITCSSGEFLFENLDWAPSQSPRS